MNIKEINDIYFISAIKRIKFCVAWLNAINSASVVINQIYICNLLHCNTEHPTYAITYPIRKMALSALLEST